MTCKLEKNCKSSIYSGDEILHGQTIRLFKLRIGKNNKKQKNNMQKQYKIRELGK